MGYPPPQYQPYQQPPPPPQGSGGMGCFAKGCLVVGVFVILGIMFGGVTYLVVRGVKPFMTQEQQTIRANKTTPAQYQAAMQKVQAFAGGQTNTVSLTSDDLNSIAAHSPDSAKYRDAIYMQLDGNQLTAEFSMPAERTGGRHTGQTLYFNARIVTGLTVDEGTLTLTPTKIEGLHGETVYGLLPKIVANADFLSEANDGINRDLRNDEQLRPLLERIGSGRIENGQLVLTAKEGTPAEATPAETPSTEPSPPVATPAQ